MVYVGFGCKGSRGGVKELLQNIIIPHMQKVHNVSHKDQPHREGLILFANHSNITNLLHMLHKCFAWSLKGHTELYKARGGYIWRPSLRVLRFLGM